MPFSTIMKSSPATIARELLANTQRGALPMAHVQLEMILRVIGQHRQLQQQQQLLQQGQDHEEEEGVGDDAAAAAAARAAARPASPAIEQFAWLDLGCGDGILGRCVQRAFPFSIGVFLDGSDRALRAAQQLLLLARPRKKQRPSSPPSATCGFVQADYSLAGGAWMDSLPRDTRQFDVIVSGFAVHHLTGNDNKKALYAEIFRLLNPGGLFLNLDRVSNTPAFASSAGSTDDSMTRRPPTTMAVLALDATVDALYDYFLDEGISKTREELQEANAAKPNTVAPLELQSQWLREIGFEQVDCYFKYLEHALFGGVKPE